MPETIERPSPYTVRFEKRQDREGKVWKLTHAGVNVFLREGTWGYELVDQIIGMSIWYDREGWGEEFYPNSAVRRALVAVWGLALTGSAPGPHWVDRPFPGVP